MYGKPYLRLSIVHTAKVTPCHSKAWEGLNGLHVASLQEKEGREWREGVGEQERCGSHEWSP